MGAPVRASARPVDLRIRRQWPVARITAWFVLRMVAGTPWMASDGEPARHARNDAEGNAGLGQGQRFLAAASEDEGIAAFEPQHPLALAGELDQALADVALHRRRLAAALAGEFESGALAAKDRTAGSTRAS